MPQTALTVHATPDDETQIIAEQQLDDQEPISEEESGQEEETSEGSIPDEGDEADIPEEDPDNTENPEPPVEQKPVEEEPVVPEVAVPEDEESETSEKPVADDEQVTQDSGIMSVSPSQEAEITVESKSGTDADTAAVKWVGGCVDGNNKLATGKALRFRVALNDGRKLTKVEAKIGESGEGKTPVTKDLTNASADANTIYEVAWDDIKTTKTVEGASVTVGQPVQIVLTTAAQTYTLTFTGTNAKIYKVAPVDASDAAKGNMKSDEVTAAVTNAAYDTEVTYIVEANDGFKLSEAKAGDTSVAFAKTDLKENASAAATTKYDTISIKPSNYKKAWDDENIAITVKAVAAATLTAEIAENENITLSAGTSTAEDAIKYNEGSSGFGDAIAEGGLKETSVLSFGVKANTNYKIAGVTAVAKTDANEDGTAIPAADITAGKAVDGVTPYTVSLKSLVGFDKNTTITITVATTYDDDYKVTNVHEVTFAGDLTKAVVTIGDDEAELPENKTVEAVTDNAVKTLKIKVTPNAGYELPKRGGEGSDKDDSVITVKKQVSYETDEAGKYGTPAEQTEKLKVENGAATLTLVGEDKNYVGGTADGAADKKFTVVSATVTIDTVFEANDTDKVLRVDNQLEGAEYSVQYGEAGSTTFKDASLDETLSEDNSDAGDDVWKNTWYIPKTAERVKVSVDTDKVPEVVLGIGDGSDVTLTEEGDGYNYIFPAKNLTDGSSSVSTLTITEAPPADDEPATVKVKLNTSDVTLTEYKVGNTSASAALGTEGEDGYYKLADAVIGKSLFLTFTKVEGANFKSVAYKMGDQEGKVTPTKSGAATLEIEEVTGEVVIDVESESAYVVKLYDGSSELEKGKDGVYEADYTTQGITIKLFKTENQKDDVDFYDVVVKDGEATAETEAEVDTDGKFATLGEIHKSERGKVLTINVYKKGQEEPFTAKLRTNANSSEVKVTRVVDGKTTAVAKDATVEMPLDARMTFKVESVGASVSDLGVKLFKEDGTALTAAEQAWFANGSNISIDEDGTFTITTTASKDARGKVAVRIFNENEEVTAGQTEKALEGGSFKLDVKGYMADNDVTGITAAPGTASNTAVRINLNATFRNKKNLPADPVTGDLYYKVVLDEITVDGELPASVAKLTGAELTKYYRIDEYDYANPAKTVAIELVKDTRTGDAAQDDIANKLTTSIKEVALVQSVVSDNLETKATVTEGTDYVASKHTAIIKDKDKVLETKKPLYETKLSVKTMNGAAVFTGQENVKVATPVFGKETGYDELTVQFVDTKTGVLKGSKGTTANAPAESDEGGFQAWVDPQDNSVYVSATEGSTTAADYKTLGVKVTASYPTKADTGIDGDGYAATAVVKLNVKQGIYLIEADESKAKLPETIFVVPGSKGKNGSAKITLKYNGGYKSVKPAKAAVTWTIDSEYQNANIQKNLNAVNAKGKAAPTITVKNGTVTVTKDYQFGKTDEENTFTVTAKAADFAGNEEATYEDFTFTITDEQDKLVDGSIVIVKANGEVKDASALKAEDFDEALYVAALKNDVKKGLDRYTASTDFMPVTIVSGSKANLEVGQPDRFGRARLTFKKPGTKLKINVNTVDGGKASKGVKVKDTLLLTIAPYENLGLALTGADGSEYSPEHEDTIQYAGGSNQMYVLNLQHKHTVGTYEGLWQNDSQYKNVKVKVDGGKLITNKYWAKNLDANKNYQPYSMMGTAVVVTSKDGKAKITVTDTANPNKASNFKVYNIANTSFNAASQKAPSIKLVSPKKITNDALYNEDDGNYSNPIVYQVKGSKVDYAGQYVKISPDYTAANNAAEELADENGFIDFKKIDENGYFEIYPGYLDEGSYKMIATVCEQKRGEILPLAKDVKLSFSIPKAKKYNYNLSVTASYKLDAMSSKTAKIAVKTDDRLRYVVSEAKNVIKTKDQGTTKGTHTNQFTKYFEVKPIENAGGNRLLGYTIGLRDNLTAADITYITGKSETKELQKQAKEDCVGYITVTNAQYVTRSGDEWVTSGKEYNTKDIKVTISFKENKYTVEGASVFAPNNAAVKVNVRLMNGKQPVSVVAAALLPSDKDGFTADNGVKAVSLNGRTGVIEITSKTTAEAKKHEVLMKVVPADSGIIKTATWNSTANKWDLTYLNKEGNTAYASEAEMIAACGVDVKAVIDVKAVDAKKVFKTKSTNIVLNAGNYVPGTAGKMGEYAVLVPYEFVAGNTAIAAAALAKDTKTDKTLNEVAGKVDGKDLITISTKDGNNTITDDDGRECIRIVVSKAVLNDQYVKTEANKKAAAKDKVAVVTTYGAKLKVPVTFTYTNNGATTETVTFNVTMPKKPMTFDEVKSVLNGTTTLGTGKNARDIKAEIEKLTTPQDDASRVILNGLLYKVWEKVYNTIPADADVTLTPDWSSMEWWNQYDGTTVTKAELNDGNPVKDTEKGDEADYDGIMDKGTAVITLTLKNDLATGDGATAALTYTCKQLGVKHKVGSDGNAIEEAIQTAIQNYLDSDEFVAANDLESADLLAAIWGLDGVKEYNSDRDSVNIWIKTFDKTEATERKAGSLKVEVCINDETHYTASKTKTIDRIKNIGDAQTALSTALSSTNVLAIVDDCSGIEGKIEAKILADAKEAIGNDKITVAYAQRDKAGSTTGEKEDDFTYQAPTSATTDAENNAVAAKAGSIAFSLEAKSQTGRTVKYTFSETEIPDTKAALYFATAADAVAAVTKTVVTSGNEGTEQYDVLATTLASVGNTQEAVAEAVKAKLEDDELEKSILGWTAKDIVVTYTPAEPAVGETAAKPGKVSITANIVLTGDESMKGEFKVENAAVVPWKAAFQTAAQLKAAITVEAAKTIEVNDASSLPEESALKNTINTLVGSLVTGTDLSAAIDDTADPAPAYSKDSTANTVKWENVKIDIKKGEAVVDSVTVTFNWAVKSGAGD